MKITRVKDPKTWTLGFWKGTLKAYLEGKKNMNWVVGCLRGISMQEFDSIVLELPGSMIIPSS